MSRQAISDLDQSRIQTIRAAISAASDDVRARHSWLRHQDAIGALIMALSIAGAVASKLRCDKSCQELASLVKDSAELMSRTSLNKAGILEVCTRKKNATINEWE